MARILIVDDDIDLVNATKEVLESRGHKTLEAHDGDAGFKKAKTEKPDLLLLDVMMKHDKEGFEIARKLKEDEATKHIPVILITGIKKVKGLPFSFEPDDDWLPVKAVLDKPVKPAELLASVEKALK